jgi:hypothetical protein
MIIIFIKAIFLIAYLFYYSDMKKKERITLRFVQFMAAIILLSGSLLLCSGSDKTTRIEIVSYVVRDRVILLNQIEMRSMIIVAFKILPKLDKLTDLTVVGKLYCNNKLISQDKISNIDSLGNNLGFDIPLSKGDFNYDKIFSIPEGRYLIVINLFDQHQRLLAQYKKELNRNQIGRRFYGFNKIYKQPCYLAIDNITDDSRIRHQTIKINGYKNKDYVVFQKSYLERVYPNTEPDASEYIEVISAEISRNEYKPLTFSIRALRNLGRVQISVTPLRSLQGILDSDSIRVGTVGQLTEIVGSENDPDTIYYRWAPKIIEFREVTIPQSHTQAYWVTLKANHDTKPGDYHGVITIKPQFSPQFKIPLRVKVLPLKLTDTDIQYGMMMTYAFYELDNDIWTEQERALIKKRGFEIYEDFREHGMTMVYPHSYFYLKYDAEGKPVLDSLKASLESYKKLAFPGPFCWYMGHLLQTAKPSHPGSITNYDAHVSEKRLHELLSRFETMAKELGIPKEKLIVQLVDEADDRDRVAAGKELNKIARQLGFKTLVTRKWPEVDVICTGIPRDEREAAKLKQIGKQWWIYSGSALTSKNLGYTRYVFGFGAWKWGVNGVVPWTFQMSQGCNGNPFTVLDGPEVMVAYPGVKGPIPTPTWEAIRDGINDYKYIYLLKILISVAKVKGNPKANLIEHQLQQLKQNLGQAPGEEEYQFGDWSPESFSKRRKQIVDWTLELYQSS